MDGLPPGEPVRRPRRSCKVLVFVREFVRRKFKRGLSDCDLLLLVTLASSARAPRFFEVRNLCPNISSTGCWNSLERLEDNGLVKVAGPPLAHTYALTDEGIQVLSWLANSKKS